MKKKRNQFVGLIWLSLSLTIILTVSCTHSNNNTVNKSVPNIPSPKQDTITKLVELNKELKDVQVMIANTDVEIGKREHEADLLAYAALTLKNKEDRGIASEKLKLAQKEFNERVKKKQDLEKEKINIEERIKALNNQ